MPQSDALTVCIILTALVCADAATNGSRCLSRFYSERHHFEPCKKQTCFLFLDEPPYIKVDHRMKTEKDQMLFDCRNRRRAFRDLDGNAFHIHQELNIDDVQCVWAGADCTFNNMVRFVAERAEDNKTSAYRFAITGLLTQLPSRESLYTLSTVAFEESDVIIVGRSNGVKNPVHRSFSQIFQAFQPITWVILGLLVVLFFTLALCISAVFSAPFSRVGFLMNLFGEHDHIRENLHESRHPHSIYPGQRDRMVVWEDRIEVQRSMTFRLLHRGTVTILRIAVSAFVIITILFYEVSVVNFIFRRQSSKIGNVSDMSDDELRSYSVPKGTAEEDVWARAVDPTGTRFPTREYPWYRCQSAADCTKSYGRILNNSHPVNFMVTFGAVVKYKLKQQQACEKLTVYETSKPLYSFSSGWYLGRSVPEKQRAEINRELLQLKLQGTLRNILRSDGGVSFQSCGKKNVNIGPDLIAIPLLFIAGPCILSVFMLLLWGCLLRSRTSIMRSAEMPKTTPFTLPPET